MVCEKCHMTCQPIFSGHDPALNFLFHNTLVSPSPTRPLPLASINAQCLLLHRSPCPPHPLTKWGNQCLYTILSQSICSVQDDRKKDNKVRDISNKRCNCQLSIYRLSIMYLSIISVNCITVHHMTCQSYNCPSHSFQVHCQCTGSLISNSISPLCEITMESIIHDCIVCSEPAITWLAATLNMCTSCHIQCFQSDLLHFFVLQFISISSADALSHGVQHIYWGRSYKSCIPCRSPQCPSHCYSWG